MQIVFKAGKREVIMQIVFEAGSREVCKLSLKRHNNWCETVQHSPE